MADERDGNSLNGKNILVTGGGNGIGRAVVSVAAAEGANVAIFDIDAPRLKDAADEVTAAGGNTYTEVVDLTDRASVFSGVESVLQEFGHLDSLLAVAGGSGTTETYLDRDDATGSYNYRAEGMSQLWTEEVAEADWDGTLDFNLKAVFHCVQAVLPSMKARRQGSIVAFSSTGAMTGSKTGAFAYAAYAASKAGISGLVRHLASELGPFNIRANAVSPGAVANPRMVVRREAFEKALEESVAEGRDVPERGNLVIPLGRASETREQAEAAIFLASDRASYVSGVTLDVNGGMHMR